jgi:aspartate ammonia-lyase
MDYRIEKDGIGDMRVPHNAYWGIHTQRALANFAISDLRVNKNLIKSFALVKKACAQANAQLGLLDPKKTGAIIAACGELAEGNFADQFPVDALQGGAGTSTNMNVNEVICNRAIELLGRDKGDYSCVHPLEDVNLNQSTNDTYPTALKVAAIMQLRVLSQEIAGLQGAFQKKEKEFAGIVTIGRTEMQEAVPITLGAEFGAFADAFGRDRWRTFKCEERLRLVNIGGTAVGTGITAPRSYIFLVIEKLRDITGLGLARGENVLDQTANSDCFVEVSGILKAHASNLIKICNDLRLKNLLGEIRVPALQAGSSIMPGKVNPVMLETAMQAGMKVIANDMIITDVCSRSTLQINEFMPLIAHSLLESLDILIAVNKTLAQHVSQITADEKACRGYFEKSPMIITALVPHIGYEKASALIEEFFASGRENLKEFLCEKLDKKLVDNIFSPYNLTSLGYKTLPHGAT